MVRKTNQQHGVNPMSIVWIASYPKSGNTWIRFMLYSAIYGPPTCSGDVPAKIPDLHRQLPFEKPESGPIYIKSHFQLTDKHPQINDTHKAIHIIRNPRDVMLSAINYLVLTNKGPKEFAKEQFVKSFLKIGGDRHWKKMGFGTWASHAQTWRSTTKFPVLPMRYEDLKADPRAELVRMLAFLEVSRTDEQIDQAVIASSFDSMKALEIREKQADKGNENAKRFFVGTKNATRKGVYFMNQGKSNQSLDQLIPGLDEKFNKHFKEALEEFGYNA